MFGHRAAKQPQENRDNGLRAQLNALGYLLEQRGYTSQGLCIIAVEDGFVVNGLKIPPLGEAYGFEEARETIEATELTAAMARVRG